MIYFLSLKNPAPGRNAADQRKELYNHIEFNSNIISGTHSALDGKVIKGCLTETTNPL